MLINADFSNPAIVTPNQHNWVSSPQSGVERIMLDRIGAEKARATSLVRFAPASYFPEHHHPGGEEILVLSGTFSEADHHYPTGWYMRNPPGSYHQPYSDEGVTIFVKLWQMRPDDDQHVRINTHDPSNWQRQEERESCLLFSDNVEHTTLERLAPNVPLFSQAVKRIELLILKGGLYVDDCCYTQGSWLRLPAGEYPNIVSSDEGVTLYLKVGNIEV